MMHHFNENMAAELSVEAAIVFENLGWGFRYQNSPEEISKDDNGNPCVSFSMGALMESMPYFIPEEIDRAIWELDSAGYYEVASTKHGVDKRRYSISLLPAARRGGRMG